MIVDTNSMFSKIVLTAHNKVMQGFPIRFRVGFARLGEEMCTIAFVIYLYFINSLAPGGFD